MSRDGLREVSHLIKNKMAYFRIRDVGNTNKTLY